MRFFLLISQFALATECLEPVETRGALIMSDRFAARYVYSILVQRSIWSGIHRFTLAKLLPSRLP